MHRSPYLVRARLRQAGFSLVELMVASAVGLLILAGMATLFVNNSKTQAEIEKANRQIENGRYGIQLLSTDLTNAGFYGEFDPSDLPDPAAVPDVCATDLDALRAALPLPVQGLDRPDATALTCLPDRKSGTDVLVVRRTQTCVAGSGNCAPLADGGVFLQASLCYNNSELGSGDPENHYDFDTNPANLTRRQRDCDDVPGSGTPAVVRRYLVHVYYVANNSEAGDGIPTLKRAELGGVDELAFTVAPLVEGIDNFQVEFGLGAGVFSAEPATVADWRKVVAVKLHLLARNLDATPGYSDSMSYTLGSNPDGSEHIVSAPGDHYKRHVFQSQVVLRNPAGRMM
jgi:type IV pilus assembly protein PilW